MKAIKIIAAIIISMFLLVAEGVLGGLFGIDRALSEDTVRESMSQSDVVGRLVDEALSENTVNMGGEYGDMIKAVFKSDAMEAFFTDYMVAAINTGVYGDDYEEVANDELLAAFSRGIDEVNESGAMSISTMEEEILKQAMMQEIPDLTATLNNTVSAYEATEGRMTQELTSSDESLQMLMGTGVRIVLIIVCIGLMAALIALFWQSKLGFIWSAVVTAAVTFIYGITALTLSSNTVGTVVSSSDSFILSIATKGLGVVSLVGMILTVLLIVACVVLRHFDKKRRRGNSSLEPELSQATTWKRAD